jgi:Fe-coproporphyrin III synthase
MCPLYGEHRDPERNDASLRFRDELRTSEIQSVLEQCARMGTKSLQFTGDEPLLNQDLPSLIRLAKQLGMKVGVISNGSILSDKKGRDITAAGLDWLHVSLDGPGEIHNSIRRVPDMFSRIEANLEALLAHREHLNRTTPAVTLGCTVSALNQRCLHELVPIAAKWRAQLIFSPIFFALDPESQPSSETSPRIKPENWLLPEYIRNLDIEQLVAELSLLRRLGRQYGAVVNVEMETTARQLRAHFFSPSYLANNKCLYPWYATRMSPYGDIYNCSLQLRMGNIREQSMDSIWNSPQYVSFRQALRKHGVFKQCARCCALNPRDVISRLLPRFAWNRSHVLSSNPVLWGTDKA